MTDIATEKVKDRAITIRVNNKPVEMTEHRPTGLEIKQAAIAQGVDIQLDFKLSQKIGAKFKPVKDDERVTINKNSEFSAIAGDDNS
jgi:hypothetical protein